MLTITSIQQIDELVAKYLGWEKTDVGWFYSEYSDYSRLPHFSTNSYWNQKVLDYLLINEQCKVTYTLYSDSTEVNIEYLGSDKWYCETRVVHMLRAEQLTLCLAFLNYMGVEFTLDKKIYNDINNN